jgi:hypothetical protein
MIRTRPKSGRQQKAKKVLQWKSPKRRNGRIQRELDGSDSGCNDRDRNG